MYPDVTMFTPGGRPGVADEPILLSIFFTVTNQHDSVVNVRVHLVAAVEDTAVISTPVAGINRYGDGANGSYCIDQLKVVVSG